MNSRMNRLISTAVLGCLILAACASPDAKPDIVDNPDVAARPDDYLEPVHAWFKSVQQPSGLVVSREGLENSDWAVSLYDQALSAMVFLCFGEPDRARQILDVFKSRQAELEAGLGGFYQFRRTSGDPNTGTNRWLGDNAYLLAALYNYAAITDDQKRYGALLASLESWIVGLQEASGGLISGSKPPTLPSAGISEIINEHIIVEGNIDAFGAVPDYTEFHEGILRYFRENRWDKANQVLICWPGAPDDDWTYASDNIAWGCCAINNLPASFGFAEARFRMTDASEANGTQSTGFCFDGDRDTIHPEATLSMAAAYQVSGVQAKAAYYVAESEKLMVQGRSDPESWGLPYSSGPGTSFGGDAFSSTHYDRPWVSSSAWYVFVRKGFNPFGYARGRSIPEADAFPKP